MQFLEQIYNKNSKKDYIYIYTEYRKQAKERMFNGLSKGNNKKLYKYLSEAEEIKE
jgi:uncharacterized protein YcbK (DUF882 family)